MKFAKKKTNASSGDEQPDKKPGKKQKPSKTSKEAAGSGLKKLGSVGLNQSLVVLVAGVVAVVLARRVVVALPGRILGLTAGGREVGGLRKS